MGLVRLAAERGGSLTVAEVAAVTDIELARAERLLDGLCRRGLAEHRIADDGSLVYRVRPLLGAAEKARAKGVLDA
jgi:DNA-binding IclR family transcriptional regulator